MKQLRRPWVAGLAFGIFAFSASQASQLLVEPIGLELTAPTNAGTLTLRNTADVAVSVQTRVFKWRQVDGGDQLEPTAEVGASPPLVRLQPGANYTVRVVRITRAPLLGEESYRLLIDQLPQREPDVLGGQNPQGNVNLLVRQSIPIFFKGLGSGGPDVSWLVKLDREHVRVVATNRGDTRLRVASLRLHDSRGSTLSFGNGLSGYVLGRSTMVFETLRSKSQFGSDKALTLEAESNFGHVNASAAVQTAP